MSDLSRIPAPDGMAPAARCAPVVTGTGRLVAFSGRLPLDEAGAPPVGPVRPGFLKETEALAVVPA